VISLQVPAYATNSTKKLMKAVDCPIKWYENIDQGKCASAGGSIVVSVCTDGNIKCGRRQLKTE
jgi:hypothetical protein